MVASSTPANLLSRREAAVPNTSATKEPGTFLLNLPQNIMSSRQHRLMAVSARSADPIFFI